MAAINNNKSSRPIDGRERLIEFPSADSINSNRNDLHHRQYTLNTGRSKTMDDQRIWMFGQRLFATVESGQEYLGALQLQWPKKMYIERNSIKLN